jgi:hypothetical protein
MRTLTITALLATLVAIPLIVRHYWVQVPAEGEQPRVDDSQRYDLFEFIS